MRSDLPAQSSYSIPYLASFARAISISVAFLNGVIGLRFFLKCFGADPLAGFSRLVYGITEPFLIFFRDIFPLIPIWQNTTLIGNIEASSLLAIMCYSFVFSGWARLLIIIEKYQTQKASMRYYWILFAHTFFNVLEGLLCIRVLLKGLSANSNAGFSQLIYGITEPFLIVFRGVFPTIPTIFGIIELSTILAIIIYAIVSWGIEQLIQWMARQSSVHHTSSLNN
jgi:uncharacterized protein YggT (Ycf19 family)